MLLLHMITWNCWKARICIYHNLSKGNDEQAEVKINKKKQSFLVGMEVIIISIYSSLLYMSTSGGWHGWWSFCGSDQSNLKRQNRKWYYGCSSSWKYSQTPNDQGTRSSSTQIRDTVGKAWARSKQEGRKQVVSILSTTEKVSLSKCKAWSLIRSSKWRALSELANNYKVKLWFSEMWLKQFNEAFCEL